MPKRHATIAYMKTESPHTLRLVLSPSSEQYDRLRALQSAFGEVCNAIAPLVAQTSVWNRVALHHMAYRAMREQFPALGAQMICNAIYAVSRICRHVFQSPQSPYLLSRLPGRALPLLHFSDACPVYLDRHTFSLKNGHASLFTLGGRMRFELDISPQNEQLFHDSKLLEILLLRVAGHYTLNFHLSRGEQDDVNLSMNVPLPPSAVLETDARDDVPYINIDGQPVPLPAQLTHGRIAPVRATPARAAPTRVRTQSPS